MNLLRKNFKALVAALLCFAIVLQCWMLNAKFSYEAAAESTAAYNITLKLNGGKRAGGESASDVVYTSNSNVLTLTHDKVTEMFQNDSPFLYDGDSYLSNDTDPKGAKLFAKPLLYGLFADTNADGELNGEEKLYISGDKITLTGDAVLTCYYADNGYVHSQASWGMDQAKVVTLAKAWNKDADKPVHDSGILKQYYAEDMQPLYMKVGAIGDQAFSTGGWCNAVTYVSIPKTVEMIGYEAFKQLNKLTAVDGLENVYGIDPNAFMMTGVEKFVFANINFFQHYAFALDTAVSKIIIERWQNDGTPRFFADNGNNYFGVSNPTMAVPNGYIYVPSGKTVEWYTSSDRNNFNLMKGDGGKQCNIPMREMFVVNFELNGAEGNLANQHQDAGAVSVKIENAEKNLTSFDGDTQLTATNEAAADLALLNIEKPEIPLLDGKVFKGWMDQDGYMWKDSDFGASGKALTKNMTLTAQWANPADITYELNNGQDAITMTVAEGSYLSVPEDPIAIDGYGFDSWYKDEELTTVWDFDTDLATDGLTIYAGYFAINYNITYELSGGTAGSGAPSQYNVEGEVTLVNPTKSGFTFGGWYDNATFTGEAITNTGEGSTGAKKFYAKWIETYTISYELSGGSAGANAPASYNNFSDDITLVAATREGYTFGGWFDNAEFTGQAALKIEKGSSGNKTFYAKWTKIEDKPSGGTDNGDKEGGCGGMGGLSIGLVSLIGLGTILLRKNRK